MTYIASSGALNSTPTNQSVFDVALHWLLVVVRRHTAPPPFDFTGAGSVTAVTHGSVDARQCNRGDARQCGRTAV